MCRPYKEKIGERERERDKQTQLNTKYLSSDGVGDGLYAYDYDYDYDYCEYSDNLHLSIMSYKYLIVPLVLRT